LAIPPLLVFVLLISGSPLVAQDSQQDSATKSLPQQVLPRADAPEKPAPDASANTDSCSVEGTVVSAAGSEPLRGARVTLSGAEAEPRSPHNYAASTDREGHFLISNVAPGRYQFRAAKPGFIPQSYSPTGNGSSQTILELLGGQKLDKILFKLSRAAVILGRVTDENGEPVVGVQVEALASKFSGSVVSFVGSPLLKGQWIPVKVATTNDLGEYRIYGLNPGGYYVAAIDSGMPELGEAMGMASVAMAVAGSGSTGFASINSSDSFFDSSAPKGHALVYYPGVIQREEAQKIRLSAGQETRVDFSLRSDKTVTVSGSVLDLKGKPAAQTAVLLGSQHLEAMLSSMRTAAVTDAQGKFEIKGVTPGSYLLSATSTQELRTTWAEQPLEIAGEDVTGIQLQLSGGLKLSGKLLAGASADIDLTTIGVFLSAPGGFERSGWSDVKKDGAFTFPDLRNTTYTLQVSNVPDGWYLSSASYGGDNVLENGLRLSEETGSHSLDITVKPGAGQVDGVVLKGDDPVPGAMVKLLPEHASPYRQDLPRAATTDQRGRFLIKNVVPGSYRIVAVAAKSDTDDDEDSGDDSASGTSLAVAEKESKTVQLKLAAKEQ
jgi:protocatechuate 3,4-dioxygenase beta subunit